MSPGESMGPVDRLTAALADRYRIERELGRGGMATVYLAEDLKHERKVAIKVLKPELAAVLGADRFVQEIKTTAALQHPHILPLHDSGEADGFLFYVMPFIDGETLRDKLDRETQLGVDEAVRITTEVADALHYAHSQGVIHRDIKPENILLHDGRPMVADFGIALALSAAAGGRMTETGMSLGTPHYMSPEQATAEKEITARSDVYSLGSVLYEMLTGEPPHMGNSAQQIIMKIIAEDAAPVTKLRKSVPANVAAAVGKSLEKLPADRFESAKAFAEALGNPGFTVARSGTDRGTSSGSGPVARLRRILVATVVVAAIAVAAAAYAWLRTGPEPEMSRFPVVLWHAEYSSAMQAGAQLTETRVSIAPDGSSIVFSDSVNDGVELRRKRRGESRSEAIPGTSGGHGPFFSPDSRWVGYFTTDGRMRRVPVDGGGPVDVATDAAKSHLHGTWLDDNSIVYLDNTDNVRRIPAMAGKGETLLSLKTLGGLTVAAMSALPDSRGVLLTTCAGNCTSETSIAVLDLRTDSVHVLVERALGAWYAPTGHLLYTRLTGELYAVRFDLGTLKPIGGEVFVMEGVRPLEFTLSRSGAVLYSTGIPFKSANLGWVTRNGTFAVIDSAWRADFYYPQLAPDSQQIAVSVLERTSQLWVRRPDGKREPLTQDGPENWRPTWRADGKAIAFVGVPAEERRSANDRDVFVVSADRSGPPRRLLHQERATWEVEYSRDGRWLVDRMDDSSGSVIHARRLDGDTTRLTIPIAVGFTPRQVALSPDSRWLAYIADGPGGQEVYVTSFPDGKIQRLVSQGGGLEPRWSYDGRELYFKSGGKLMAVSVAANPSLELGVPRPLFLLTGYRNAPNRQQYDVAPDGRFLMIREASGGLSRELIYAENWFQELRALTKVK